MTPEKPNADQAAPDDELVAYLDGELDDEAGRRIEELLAADSTVRQRLQQMEQTWDLLGKLGDAHVDERFTRTTMEMVALAVEEDVQQQQAELPRRRRRQWLVGSSSLLAAGVAGFLAVTLFWPNPDKQLLNDLPVLENLDQYRQIGDIEFLQLLHREGLFAEDIADES